MMQKKLKMTETLANRSSNECTQREVSNEYQYDRVKMSFQNRVLWIKVALALKGLIHVVKIY